MALTMEQAEAEASRLRQEHDRLAERLTSDPRLTDETKREEIRQSAKNVNARIAQMNAEVEATVQAQARDAMKAVLSPDAVPASERLYRDASYRDSLERATQAASLDAPDSLVRFLDRADMTGDELGARAALAVAYERGDTATIARFVELNPEMETKVQAAFDTVHRANDTRELIGRAMRLHGLAAPETVIFGTRQQTGR